MASQVTPTLVVDKYARLNETLDGLEGRTSDISSVVEQLTGLGPFMDWIDGREPDTYVEEVMQVVFKSLNEAALWTTLLETGAGNDGQRIISLLKQANDYAREHCPKAYGIAPPSPPPPSMSDSAMTPDDNETEAEPIDPAAVKVYEEGMEYYQGTETVPRSFRNAAAKFVEASQLGHHGASKILGDMYLHGKGVKPDYSEALARYATAAQANNADAAYNIASLYYKGGITELNLTQSLVWYQYSADRGLIKSNLALATMQTLGLGTENGEPDLASALYNLRIAAHANNPEAQFSLAVCLAYGIGVTAHARRSFAWLLRAARNGHLESQATVGAAFTNPNHDAVVVNHAHAFVWLSKAAERGHPEAQYKLGQLYATPDDQFIIPEPVLAENQPVLPEVTEGSEPVELPDPILVQLVHDMSLAFKWFEAAALQDHAPAQYELALILFTQAASNPENASSLTSSANDWLTRAANAGYPAAQFKYAEYASGGFNLHNINVALPWVRSAATSQYLPAILQLISWVECGACGAGDAGVDKLAELYAATAALGDAGASAWLEQNTEVASAVLLTEQDQPASVAENVYENAEFQETEDDIPLPPPIVDDDQEQVVLESEVPQQVVESVYDEDDQYEDDSAPPPPPPPPQDDEDDEEVTTETPSEAPQALMSFAAQMHALEDSEDDDEAGSPPPPPPPPPADMDGLLDLQVDNIALPSAPEDD